MADSDRWFEKITDKLAIELSLNNHFETFEVRTQDTRFSLYPNAGSYGKIKLSYDFLSFGYKFTSDFLPGNADENKKGKTESFGFETTIILNQWFGEISFSKVKGYYLKNSQDFNTWSSGDPYIQFPNLHYTGIDLITGYIFNPRFSYKSLYNQTERQLKSAGSFSPFLKLHYYVINDKSSDVNTQKSNNFELSAGPGYSYNYVVIPKFYISAGLFGNAGFLRTKLTTRFQEGNITGIQNNFIFRWEGRAGLGYNGDKFYTGLYARYADARYRQENTSVLNHESQVFYHIFFGIRLNPPASIQRIKNIKPD